MFIPVVPFKHKALAVCLLSLLTRVKTASECNGHGFVSYMGPANRTVCTCDLGWKGVDCEQPMTSLDYGPFRPCNQSGIRDVCDKGMQCFYWLQYDRNLCTCDADSSHAACMDVKKTACWPVKCRPGLLCTHNGGVCAPDSSDSVCQCDGEFTDPDTSTPIQCKRGKNGYCTAQDGSNKACTWPPSYADTAPESAPALDACPPGKVLNNLQQCVCEPLSVNAECQPKPPPTKPGVNNVCARFNSYCTKPYDVQYAVFKANDKVSDGTETVKPRKNYLIETEGIANSVQSYDICIEVVDSKTSKWKFDDSACAVKHAGYKCCMQVTSSAGATNFTSGCAQFDSVFTNSDC